MGFAYHCDYEPCNNYSATPDEDGYVVVSPLAPDSVNLVFCTYDHLTAHLLSMPVV